MTLPVSPGMLTYPGDPVVTVERVSDMSAGATSNLSIDGSRLPVHRTLLGAGVVIVEGLDLREAPMGASTIWCLPLKLRDGDGGPARVLLIVD